MKLTIKQFNYLCAWTLILGCQGVTPGFAGDSAISPVALQSEKGVYAQSAKSVRSSTQFQNVEGTLKEIQGNVYVVEGAATKQPIRLEVGRDTAFPNGQKEPGQMLQALISTSDGHALIVR